ncbi:G-type lectin S-receptor-like serine/threonine-protein kinase SD2-5 isoform X2 [Tripterygium wilfordii]|uniref:G-type lectin S-receptor-like serine/threonine-protein kinase SD2-5 isoform X2 n=1 Tax=Tripterygium wilfordii TaxID=458696 RepID=UPI0018F805B2|nr:G-type lectin S-receptor-like serine/threonine-protein kinase SD2-5 isoform X2 [Tripterygium wilfordii]
MALIQFRTFFVDGMGQQGRTIHGVKQLSFRGGNGLAWSTNNTQGRATSMQLKDSGNLVLLGVNETVLWQSFSHPTDTLLPGQEFVEGMTLKSFPNRNKLSNFLAIESGDFVLYAGYQTPQVYWSLVNDNRKSNNSVRGKVHSASLVSNSWNFYDQNKVLLWQFTFSENSDPNATWAAILGSDGAIGFYNLQRGTSVNAEGTKIPQNSCRIPEPCERYNVCFFDNWCECPAHLQSQYDCKPPVTSACSSSKSSVDLFYVGEKLDYFALGFVTPLLKSDLHACKEACLSNCSCAVLFFANSTGSCFLFEEMGSLTRSVEGSAGYTAYVKVSSGGEDNGNKRKHAILIVIIVVATLLVIACLVYAGIWYLWKRKKFLEFPPDNLEDDIFWDNLSGMPIRFSFSDLCKATKYFTMKIGQGGFGSVYLGMLPDGTQVAVKKLEGIGQGKKEFRAEVSMIGSIHHVHLVKLKGFCAEGAHRLLVYEYMGNGSLDRWIFQNNEGCQFLDWDTRFNVALGTAKGLAYLHEECEVKIVHCDIKPQNVLLDDNFTAKVSDFGLAKLMNRDESLVYTTLRGTRGYLAPEWITHSPISEKSDVYSYGIVLLEIIGGRKNYDMGECSEKSYFPSYAFKMLEEGKLKEILDSKLDIDENDERVVTAIKVALWCIQEDMQLRPPMTKVVQMLDGLCYVPEPPISSRSGSRSCPSFIKWSGEEGPSSGQSNYNSDSCTFLSETHLSGPR